jgi:hypothetical protein
MLGSGWEHGFSTVMAADADALAARVNPDADVDAYAGYDSEPSSLDAAVNVSSTFELRIDVLFLSGGHAAGRCTRRPPVFDHMPGFALPGFSNPLPGRTATHMWDTIERLSPAMPRSLAVPLVIGSVSEPRDALYTHRWSDLSLDANGQPAVLVDGEDLSCENGWLMPPPSYECAIQSAPYVY